MTSSRENGTADYFTVADAWTGGHYELAIELGAHSADRVARALRRLWRHPSLEGCYLQSNKPVKAQPRVNPDDHLEEKLYGIATLETRARVPCGSFLCSFEDASDWLELYLPLGALAKMYPVGGYPFDERSNSLAWRREVDNWLRGIAEYVFREIPFQLAVVGFEIEVGTDSYKSVDKQSTPEQRSEGLLLPTDEGLQWHPPTLA
jgi:hypothetical protein